MDTFGERLTAERQDRGLTIQAVAETLGVDQDLLRALERNDFGALPPDDELMDCLHAYAACLDVEADLMIEDFLQQRAAGPRRTEAASPPATPVVAPGGSRHRRLPVLWPLALAAVAIAAAAVWWMPRDRTAAIPEAPVATAPVEPVPRPPAPAADPAPQPLEPAPPAPEPPAPEPLEPAPEPAPEVTPEPVEPPTSRPAPTTPPPARLSIADHGVGTAVEDRRLVGRGESFARGTRVCFWTHVEGGARGRRIHHVWLRDGVETWRMSLAIGGPSWRTYSAKTLPADAGGSWAVEARDEAGRVLARSEFTSR